ncbi:MAG TPA: TnsA endonuclease N-terminal domain-containing protein [Pyrinomonadaceae bacterium]|jgi:hypothetical protein|nr:TnsA endonuclease N-terminal domain-containing protein [Pyrinomonadaceae bacterium]
MPVRKISNKGSKKVIGKFASLKMKRAIWWESPLERDYIYLLEFDPDVMSYEEQPLHIEYYIDGKKHRYTPDFFVRRADKRIVVEVKPEEEAFKEKYQHLFRTASYICARNGYEFVVVTNTMIRVQPQLDNIKLLTKYQRVPIDDPQYQLVCYELFAENHETSLGAVMEFFASRNISKQTIYSLLYWGILSVDLMLPIGVESMVRLSSGKDYERKENSYVQLQAS